ncbi:MAG TPA: GNAT family protein [Propioniciclava tarda]|nr:GNAT family protein [Propioniciclava tarda]HQA31890.1 GNAT family protein [Propioniciclava tarda]HQD61575.1 GNAT family protein [Propioniciclava tarda]
MEVVEFSEHLARLVCSWHYDPPFDVYNTPDFGHAHEAGWAIAMPATRAEQFRGIASNGSLIGFFRVSCRDGRLLLGVGMDPALTGSGLGREFMEAVLADVTARFAGQRIEAEVRPFNERALRCYRSAGFVDAGARTIHPLGEDVAVLVMALQLG